MQQPANDRTRAGRPRRRLLAALAVTAVVLGTGPVVARDQGDAPELGDVSVFASVPAPGHPFGIAVDDKRVYVSTSAGDFFAGHANSEDERVFTYDQSGNLLDARTTIIDTADGSDMGLFGLALDGNPGSHQGLFVADMNGRILRLELGPHPAPPTVFSQTPIAGGWMASMWNDLVFDTAGNLYVPDDKPRIWRVTPDGHASIWFEDCRLAGAFGFAGGPLGARIDPTGQWLYFTITVSAQVPRPASDSGPACAAADDSAVGAFEAAIYRIPLADPTAERLELVHAFAVDPAKTPTDAWPQATGLAFARSGNLYVSLIGPSEIAVLDPSGNEIRRISDPRFHSPWGLAFAGQSILVTNGDLEPATNPDAWKIFRVFVGESGLPLNQPRLPRR
jgi:sugar lactone lactonase YvrE